MNDKDVIDKLLRSAGFRLVSERFAFVSRDKQVCFLECVRGDELMAVKFKVSSIVNRLSLVYVLDCDELYRLEESLFPDIYEDVLVEFNHDVRGVFLEVGRKLFSYLVKEVLC